MLDLVESDLLDKTHWPHLAQNEGEEREKQIREKADKIFHKKCTIKFVYYLRFKLRLLFARLIGSCCPA